MLSQNLNQATRNQAGIQGLPNQSQSMHIMNQTNNQKSLSIGGQQNFHK